MNTIASRCTANVKKGVLAACNTLASEETRLRTTRLPPRSRPGRRCRNIETRPPPTPSTRGLILDTYAEIPHCFWALRFFLSFFLTSDKVRSFHVLFWSLQGLRGSIAVAGPNSLKIEKETTHDLV